MAYLPISANAEERKSIIIVFEQLAKRCISGKALAHKSLLRNMSGTRQKPFGAGRSRRPGLERLSENFRRRFVICLLLRMGYAQQIICFRGYKVFASTSFLWFLSGNRRRGCPFVFNPTFSAPPTASICAKNEMLLPVWPARDCACFGASIL